MATGATATYALSYPLSTDPVNIHGDLKTLADQLDLLFSGKSSTGLSNIFTQPNVFSVGSTTDAVRISQTGTGNSLLVEDSANPDSTPFVIDASGNVGIGKLSPTKPLDVVGAGAFSGALTASTFNALSLTSNTTGFTLSGGTTAVATTFAGGAAYTISGTNGTTITLPATTGTLALNNQTFYIGTQAITINAGTGTITSLPGVTSINGSTIPSAGTWYTAPTIGSTSITSGGTFTTLPGVTSVNGTSIPSAATLLTSTSTASALTSFGAGPTISLPVIDNFKMGYTTTATAAGTTTLTSASNQQQYFTGTTTQTVVLPVTSTLVLGEYYDVYNNSTGVVTVQSSGANTILAMPANTAARFTVILTTGTTAASWSAGYIRFSTITGTGANVLATSPTLVTPVLGTPSSGTLTSCTGLPLTTGVTGTLPVANGGTGITALGTGVATWMGTPSSANLAAAITDETGSGVVVFGTSPTFTTSVDGSATFTAFGSSTTFTLGGTPTTAITATLFGNATATATTKAINIGTGGASGSTTNINLGSTTSGALGVTKLNTAFSISTPPAIITGTTYTVGVNDTALIFNTTAACAVTMPAAATYPGRTIMLKQIAAFAVTAVNTAGALVTTLTGTTGQTSILSGAGKFAYLVSDGTNWVTMMAN
jgi:hypothetical protein